MTGHYWIVEIAWVTTADRLPDKNAEYLVVDPNGHSVYTYCYSPKERSWYYQGHEEDPCYREGWQPLYWAHMPVPPPANPVEKQL